MKKGFTLIELLAVLVVLAILALISIPITIRIINQARENSYKRSIESYGRAFGNAIAEYILNNPNSDYSDILANHVNELKIDLSGNNTTCDLSKSNIDSNGKITLKGCQVGNSSKYTYKGQKISLEPDYAVGDKIKVNNEYYYVIKDSYGKDDYVTALKEIPLKTSEIEQYGVGHINNNTQWSKGRVSVRYNGHTPTEYGGVTYHSSSTCGYENGIGTPLTTTGCIDDYKDADIRYIIDNWANDILNNKLKSINGYKARLMKESELIDNLGCINGSCRNSQYNWIYNLSVSVQSMNAIYWLMDVNIYPQNSNYIVSYITHDGGIVRGPCYGESGLYIRPVINVYKNAID